MNDKPVGELHCRREVIRGIAVNLFAVNHRRYINKMIATYGCNVVVGEPVTYWVARQRSISVKRNQVLHDYSSARHAVDDNNNYRQGAANGVEAAWASRRWDQRQLAFFVGLVEANSLLACNYFSSQNQSFSMMGFRARLLEGLLTDWRQKRDEVRELNPRKKTKPMGEHRLVSAPKNTKGAYEKGHWEPSEAPYYRRHCRNWKVAKTSKYCVCRIGLFLCADCFPLHIAEVVTP